LEARLGLGGLHRRDGVLVALEATPVTGEGEDGADLLGRLRTDAQPVLRTVRVDLDEGRLLGGVVLPDLLDDAAVALGARVGDDDAVVGRADLAEALETDLDSHNSPECVCETMNGAGGVGCTPGKALRADRTSDRGSSGGPTVYSARSRHRSRTTSAHCDNVRMTVPFATSARSSVGIEWEVMLADG